MQDSSRAPLADSKQDSCASRCDLKKQNDKKKKDQPSSDARQHTAAPLYPRYKCNTSRNLVRFHATIRKLVSFRSYIPRVIAEEPFACLTREWACAVVNNLNVTTATARWYS